MALTPLTSVFPGFSVMSNPNMKTADVDCFMVSLVNLLPFSVVYHNTKFHFNYLTKVWYPA